MKALKRLFAGFACVLILGTMLAPVCAAGAEPLDWDAIVHNPDYRVYYDMIELGRSFTDDAYSGSAVSTLEASKEWDFAHPDAKQTVTFQVDFSRNSYLALRKRVKQYATQNIGIRDLTESSNDTINMGWDFQDLDDRNNFISYYHGNITFKMFIRFRSDGHMKLREKSGGYYDESYEDDLTYDEAINYKLKREHVLVSRGGTMQETELAGRTAFIENYNENGSRDTYIHVFDELSEIPGFWLEINFVLHESGSLDYQPEIMREDSPDLQRVISAHRDVRETILNEVIPDLAAAQISATWSDAEGSLAESNTQTETHDAETNPGEDNGTVIRNDIVETPESSDKTGSREEVSTAAKVAVSVGGALAAAGAMGASSGKRDGGEEEKRRKTYKMKVYKGFGDAIRRGDSAVTVWARIVEVVDGQETDRPDLSERITASGEGLTVQSAGMQNNWQGASVTVPAESEKEQGVLVFTFTGEGGVFRNRIVFRIIGEPKITFPDVSEDGTRWDMNTECSRVDMITGAGGRERLRFVITDTDQEPREIRFKGHEGFAITAEKDTKWQFTYYACIENRTKPMEKVNGIFATERPVRVTVEASFEDGRTIDNYFTIWLYPDGLSACT